MRTFSSSGAPGRVKNAATRGHPHMSCRRPYPLAQTDRRSLPNLVPATDQGARRYRNEAPLTATFRSAESGSIISPCSVSSP
jgi:hypothetical protein